MFKMINGISKEHLAKLIMHQKILLFLIFCAIYVCSCGTRSPERMFTVDELLIDSSTLPQDWAVLNLDNRPIVSFYEEEAALMIFYYTSYSDRETRGGITVYQHRSEKRADQTYSKLEQGHFSLNSRWYTAPFVPEEFNFYPKFATRFRFRCAISRSEGLFDDKTICVYLAQYEEFIVFHTIPMEFLGTQIITVTEIEVLIEAIDQQIGSFLFEE